MNRLLFLDFDGVLHPAGGTPGKTLPFEWLPQLEALLSAEPDIAIAVHSSWAERYGADELREFLGALGARFVGAVGKGPKARAILLFLESRPQTGEWLVVDDDERQFPSDFPGTVVICDPLRGISDPTVQDRIRRWVSRPHRTTAK